MFDNEIEGSARDRGRGKGKRVKKGVYILPNLITSASLFAGFYSIIACIDGKFERAAIAILISAVLDGLDGRVARLTKTSSKFGFEYDSLADLVAFGLAPGVLIFIWALKPFGRYGWLAAFLYVVCGALRLARFNVQVTTVESRAFKGLPIPAAASLVASTVLFFFYMGQEETTKHITVLILVYSLAFLMVSNVKYYSFKELDLSRRMPFRFLVGFILVLIVVAAEPSVMLFFLTFGYVISGPVTILFHRKKSMVTQAGNARQKEKKPRIDRLKNE